MKKYYVYAYLDPRMPGKFQYKNINHIFSFEPFYIGKGKNERWKRHIWKQSKLYKSKNLMKNKMDELKQLGYDMTKYVVFLAENLDNDSALLLETTAIYSIGQIVNNTGSLTNILTKGGKSSSEEVTKLRSERQRLSWTIERKNKHSKIMKLLYHAPDGRIKNAFQSHRPDYKLNGRKISRTRKLKFQRGELSLRGSKNTNSHCWLFIDPYGKKHSVIGEFSLFCKENKLSSWALAEIAKNGKRYKQQTWNGWTCQKICKSHDPNNDKKSV